MSLGLVVLEKKLFTRTPTPQSDDIKSPPGEVATGRIHRLNVTLNMILVHVKRTLY